MGNRLDKERQKVLEPLRVETAILAIRVKGYDPVKVGDNEIRFEFNGNVIRFYPYTGWATGKGIKDARGLKNLLKQI